MWRAPLVLIVAGCAGGAPASPKEIPKPAPDAAMAAPVADAALPDAAVVVEDETSAEVEAAIAELEAKLARAADDVHVTDLGGGNGWLAIAEAPDEIDAQVWIQLDAGPEAGADPEEASIVGEIAGAAVGPRLTRKLAKKDHHVSSVGSPGLVALSLVMTFVNGPEEIAKAIKVVLAELANPKIVPDDANQTIFRLANPPMDGLSGHAIADSALLLALTEGGPRIPIHDVAAVAKILDTVTTAKLRKAAKRWRKGRLTILVAAPIDDAGVATIQKAVTAAVAAFDLRAPAVEEPRASPRKREVIRVDGPAVTDVVIGQVPALPDADVRRAFDLWLLSDALDERLQARLVPAMAAMALVPDSSSWHFWVAVPLAEAADPDAVDAAVLEELAAAIADGPTVAQLNAAKLRQIRRLGLHGFRNKVPDAGDLAADLAAGRTLADRLVEARRIAAVTRAEVTAAAQAALDPTTMVTAMAGSLPPP